ncbi:MAG TPA: NAD-dependent epimerase/dehydratase family protein [Chthonomonadaceae bacterium]|nr:NAD-dependent epimerase/dehydratase family protein [Chthonomonadaceae bacterium]
MKILIIGGTGFLSSALVEESAAAGHAVAIVTRGRRSRPLPAGVEQIVADRDAPGELAEAIGRREFDAVIDAICFTPEQARQDIACFAGRAGRLVMISTDFVYSVGHRRLPIAESQERNAPTEYGRKKAAAEDVLLDSASSLPATVLRPPHIMGPGGLLGTGSLQGRDPVLPARIRRGEPVVLLDGGALLIQPADRTDIACAALAVIGAPQSIGRAYNIAGPEAVTTRRYYELIAEALGMPLAVASLPSTVYLTAFPGNAPFAQHRAYALDALARDTGFRPAVSLRASIETTLAWLEANPPTGAHAPISDRDAAILALLAEQEERLRQVAGRW